jgi:5-methylcytosine-specific restriction endonuclease McrA
MALSGPISRQLRHKVAKRARFLCEYCHLQQMLCPEPFELDHIIPRAMEGPTDLNNLCLACPVCNNTKRSRFMAEDPITGRRVRLFNPRGQAWHRHFRWSDDYGMVLGETVVGRATVAALEMNHPRVVQIRLLWTALKLHPPR